MPINFPTGATTNQVYTYNNLSWQWTGSYWKIYPSTGNFLPIAGGALTGGLTATTISATTYQNLPTDIRVTGGTYNSGTSTINFTNNTGGTFSVTGITSGSATFTGGTITGPTSFTNGLTANTISATTYQNLPRDVFVTGGTYSSATSTITFRNSTGGTFTVTGITAGSGSVSGTINYVAKFTGTTGVGNSIIYDNGTNVGIGTASPAQKLDVNGDALINSITVGRKGDLTTTVVGNTALDSLVGGNSNTVYGYQSGRYITNGNNSLIIGYLNYNRPDSVNITTENNILSISKNSDLTFGYPQIWSPSVTTMGGPAIANILELDPTKYSAIFLDYVLEGKDSNNMRAGTIKAVFLIDLSKIEWVEDALPEIENTTDYIFDVKNNGSGILVVELTNNSNAELICNYTSRLLLRHYI